MPPLIVVGCWAAVSVNAIECAVLRPRSHRAPSIVVRGLPSPVHALTRAAAEVLAEHLPLQRAKDCLRGHTGLRRR